MNKTLNSLTFGYLSFKYKRLLRAFFTTISILSIATSVAIYYQDYDQYNEDFNDSFFEKYQSHYFDIYITPNGTEVNEIYLIERYGLNRFNKLVADGLLKEKECNKHTKQQYTSFLMTDEIMRMKAYYIAKQEGLLPQDFALSQYNQDYFINDSNNNNNNFIFAIQLTLINLGIFIFIFLVSYILEPFVIGKADSLSVYKNNYRTLAEPKSIESKIVIENEVVKASESVDDKKEHKNNSKIANYLAFNDEYLSGTKFWLRMLVGWITLAIFGLGFYIMLTTTYKRSQSLGFGKALSIIACIYVPIMNILTFVLLRTDYSEVNLLKSILVSIPFAYFYLKNGRRK